MITLDQANRMIAAIIKRGVELNLRPMSAIVVEPGCIPKAFQKEDGASMARFEMAYGKKCWAALSLEPQFQSGEISSKTEKPEVRPKFLIAASGERLFAEGGGMLIRDDGGDVIGAVGVTGDTEENDDALCVHGIHAVGLKTDEDCAHMGRKIGIRK